MDHDSVDASLLAFVFELRWGDGLADSSMICVRYELTRWFKRLSGQGRCWLDVTRDDVMAWLGDIVAHQAFMTVEKRCWVLRRFYSWAYSAGKIADDPWRTITRPARHPVWQPRFTPSRRAVEALLAQPDTGTIAGIRDRAILELLYATGLRASELIGLQCHQISVGEKHCIIQVMGKGQRERIVIYGEIAADWLRLYADVARQQLLARAGVTNQFFVNDTPSGALTYPVLRRAIRRYADAAGLPLLTAHSLRHAFATHLYQNGANLRAIQMLLGHSQLETTTVYVKTSMEYLQEFIEKHHPRGSKYKQRPRRGRDPSEPCACRASLI